MQDSGGTEDFMQYEDGLPALCAFVLLSSRMILLVSDVVNTNAHSYTFDTLRFFCGRIVCNNVGLVERIFRRLLECLIDQFLELAQT